MVKYSKYTPDANKDVGEVAEPVGHRYHGYRL